MTTPLRKLWQMSRQERRLLVEATLLLGAVRLGLSLLPLRTLRRCLAWATAALADPRASEGPESVVSAVVRASRCVPGAACLSQALAVQALLGRRGQAARLCIGFSRGAGGGLEGHAWVENQGRILMGGRDLAAYAPISALSEGDDR